MHEDNESNYEFEERLLAELRRVVAANPEPSPTRRGATTTFAHSWRRPLTVAGGLAAAAVASVTIIGLGGEGSGTAWAVAPNDDGTVTVEINSLRDAEGLERQLREAGIPALVQYLPPGKECAAPPAGDPLPGEFGWTTARSDAGDFATGGISGDAPWGQVVTSAEADDGIEFTINEVPDGHSLAITTQVLEGDAEGGLTIEDSAVRVEYAEGDESPCHVVDASA